MVLPIILICVCAACLGVGTNRHLPASFRLTAFAVNVLIAVIEFARWRAGGGH